MCKPWKVNGHGKMNKEHEKFSDYKRRYFARKEIVKYG